MQNFDKDSLIATLQQYRQQKQQQPNVNPVANLAFSLVKAVEEKSLELDQIFAMAKQLSDEALHLRAKALRAYTGAEQLDVQQKQLFEIIEEKANLGFESFARWIDQPKFGFVFTAHPTFLLNQALSQALAQLASKPQQEQSDESIDFALLEHRPKADISLSDEHACVQESLTRARQTQYLLSSAILEFARQKFPQQWHKLNPQLLTLASWVGYDHDGRKDILWHHSFGLRLKEKILIFQDYSTRIKALDLPELLPLRAQLEQECQQYQAIHKLIEQADTDRKSLVEAANALLDMQPVMLSKADILTVFDQLISAQASCELVALRAYIKAHSLGSNLIHLRINATQLHNAMESHANLSYSSSDIYRANAEQLLEMAREKEPWQINFADLAREQSTAIRQFMFIAQIQKFIDADAPIRFLIAECENPLTVLIALYFAKRFAVDKNIDISPLFETPDALEVGARLIERLLENPLYLDYVKNRKRLCIQAGFSDAGRFLGQIPATLAIERLQVQIARVLERKKLKDIDVLIFNTHGESMGRGAHPDGMPQRLGYVFTPYARAAYAKRQIKVSQETSIQGGDGYLLMGTPILAKATTLSSLLYEWKNQEGFDSDPFYQDKAFALDFFLSLKNWQAAMYFQKNYHGVLGAFGTNLLFKTGSRAVKRASNDARALGDPSLLRAIPHNACLQQLAIPANVVAGIGTSGAREQSRLIALYAYSDRLKSLVAMIAQANRLTKLDILSAYAMLFDPVTWTSNLEHLPDNNSVKTSINLATLLESDPRRYGLRGFVSTMQRDQFLLERLLKNAGYKSPLSAEQQETQNDLLDLLHALRLALIRILWVQIARLPHFSSSAGIEPQDVLRAAISLDVDQAVKLMRDAFPRSNHDNAWRKQLNEASNYDTQDHLGSYDRLNEEQIDPLLTLYEQIRRISVGVSHLYGAHG